MGNRAVITTDKNLDKPGIYLHWNGGRDSVEGFLAFCILREFREDDDYGFARLLQVIANYIGSDDGLSVGLRNAKELDCDNWDNGVYIIKGFDIVGRLYSHGEQLHYDLRKFVEDVNEAQPPKMKLTDEQWAKFDEVKARIEAHRKSK